MADTEIDCPYCDEEFTGQHWEDGYCPSCGTEYMWDEECTSDYSDCWSYVFWCDPPPKETKKENWKKEGF